MMDGSHPYSRNQPSQTDSNPNELAFFVAANDRDVLAQINRLMARNGYIGIMDTAGRLHFLIDGRRGTPYASRRILEATGRILCDRAEARQPWQQLLCRFVDPILGNHGIRPELTGYRYLRFMLLLIGLDDAKIKPVSKKLYPAAAGYFHVRISQIERDIRYALRESDLYRQGLTPTASICRLHQDLVRTAEQEQLAIQADDEKAEDPVYPDPLHQEKPFRMMGSPEGPLDYNGRPEPCSPD